MPRQCPLLSIAVQWFDGEREPQNPPNPAFPNGMDVDLSQGAKRVCKIELPYPARRCGMYLIACQACGLRIGVSTAGRPDDPRTVTLGCNRPEALNG